MVALCYFQSLRVTTHCQRLVDVQQQVGKGAHAGGKVPTPAPPTSLKRICSRSGNGDADAIRMQNDTTSPLSKDSVGSAIQLLIVLAPSTELTLTAQVRIERSCAVGLRITLKPACGTGWSAFLDNFPA